MISTKVSQRIRKDATIWQRLLEEKERSGQSVKVFCKTNGIKVASYYYWRKRLDSTQGIDDSLFAPIEIQAKPVTGVVVELPGGVTLRFDELPPVEYLRRLSTTFSGV